LKSRLFYNFSGSIASVVLETTSMTNKASNLPASAGHGERGESIFLQATPFSPHYEVQN
jgi:hypothetical protein